MVDGRIIARVGRRLFGLAVLVTVMAGLSAANPAQANLVQNGGFESGLAGWSTTGFVQSEACTALVVGCAPGGGTNAATLNNSFTDTATSTLTQTIQISGPGTYSFGGYLSFGTNNPNANFAQGQISLTAQVAGSPSSTIGTDPNNLRDDLTIIIGDYSFTPWKLYSGTLTYAGIGPASLIININVQNSTPEKQLVLLADNIFVSEVPLPAALPLLASSLAGLGWLRRRRQPAV